MEERKAPEKSKNYSDLEKQFENLMENYPGSEYIPNPYLTHNPKFMFIGMEPSVSAKNFTKHKIEYLTSFKNFIIHYCAYAHLCNNTFEYHLTDVSKLAMPSKAANKKDVRRNIYHDFYPLLKQEIKVLNNPTLISTKTTTKNFLIKNDFAIYDDNIMLHWGEHNFKRNRFDIELQNLSFNGDYVEYQALEPLINDFAIKLMSYLGFDEDGIKERVDFIFKKNYTDYQKQNLIKLYHYYSLKFEKIKQQNA